MLMRGDVDGASKKGWLLVPYKPLNSSNQIFVLTPFNFKEQPLLMACSYIYSLLLTVKYASCIKVFLK